MYVYVHTSVTLYTPVQYIFTPYEYDSQFIPVNPVYAASHLKDVYMYPFSPCWQWYYNSTSGTFRYGQDFTKCLDAGTNIVPCSSPASSTKPFWCVYLLFSGSTRCLIYTMCLILLCVYNILQQLHPTDRGQSEQ